MTAPGAAARAAKSRALTLVHSAAAPEPPAPTDGYLFRVARSLLSHGRTPQSVREWHDTPDFALMADIMQWVLDCEPESAGGVRNAVRETGAVRALRLVDGKR